MAVSAYLICSTPRSGSTLLCDLLKQTGAAGRPDSFYRQQSIDHWVEEWGVAPGEGVDFERRYLAAAIRAGTAGTGIFGMRLHALSLFELLGRLAMLYPSERADRARLAAAFGSPLYIRLRRADKVAQAISRLRAEQSGLWHRHADGTERERVKAPDEPTYDADRIDAYVAEATEHEAIFDSWAAAQGIAPLDIAYEDMSGDPKAALGRILVALGLDRAKAERAQIQTARLADAISTEWARRYRTDHPEG